MGLFSKKQDYDRVFRRNERVVAAYDLPGVPERTGGKIKMVNGFEWRRYWVFFDNGIQLGSLDGSALLRPHHWERWLDEREEVTAKMNARLEAAEAEQEALLAQAENPEVSTPTEATQTTPDQATPDSSDPAATTTEPSSPTDVAPETSGTASPADAAPDDEAAALLAKLPDHLVERSRLARQRLTT